MGTRTTIRIINSQVQTLPTANTPLSGLSQIDEVIAGPPLLSPTDRGSAQTRVQQQRPLSERHSAGVGSSAILLQPESGPPTFTKTPPFTELFRFEQKLLFWKPLDVPDTSACLTCVTD